MSDWIAEYRLADREHRLRILPGSPLSGAQLSVLDLRGTRVSDLGLQKLVQLRKRYDAFSGGDLQVLSTGNEHVLAYVRTCGVERAMVFANFSEALQAIRWDRIENHALKKQTPVFGAGALREELGLELQRLEFLVYAGK